MWWVGSERLDVYIGSRQFAVCRGSDVLCLERGDSWPSTLSALDQWLSSAPGKLQLRFWLSGGLCRPFLMPTSIDVKSNAELKLVAGSLASQATGLPQPAPCWVEPGRPVGARMAVAVQAGVLESLTSKVTERRHGARVLQIKPWWSAALRWALGNSPNTAGLAVQDCDSLTLLVGTRGEFSHARSVTPIVDREAADASIARYWLASDVEAAATAVVRLDLSQIPVADRRPDLPFGAFVDPSS